MKVALYPCIRDDGIGTYIRGISPFLPVTSIDYPGRALSPFQFIKPLPSGYDLYHVPHFLVPLFCGRKKVVCTIHDIIPLQDNFGYRRWKQGFLARRIEWSVRRADAIICDSKTTKEALLERFRGIIEPRVIYPGVDQPLTKASSDSSPYAFPYFISVGRRRPHKNTKRILEAFAAIQGAFDSHLVLIGKVEPSDSDLLELAAKLKVLHKVHFSGFLTAEKLAMHYRFATALLFPSLLEGFGLPVLEAMSYGCPVITSNCSSLLEIAGNAAALVNPVDLNAISTAMLRIAQD